jgi:hypothetical protein
MLGYDGCPFTAYAPVLGSPSPGSGSAALAIATPRAKPFIESWFGNQRRSEVSLNEYGYLACITGASRDA